MPNNRIRNNTANLFSFSSFLLHHPESGQPGTSGLLSILFLFPPDFQPQPRCLQHRNTNGGAPFFFSSPPLFFPPLFLAASFRHSWASIRWQGLRKKACAARLFSFFFRPSPSLLLYSSCRCRVRLESQRIEYPVPMLRGKDTPRIGCLFSFFFFPFLFIFPLFRPRSSRALIDRCH